MKVSAGLYSVTLRLFQLTEDLSLQYYSQIADFVHSESSKLSTSIERVYNKYGKPVTGK